MRNSSKLFHKPGFVNKIKISCRFVQKNKLRLLANSACNACLLKLPARKRMNRPLCKIRYLKLCKGLVCKLFICRCVEPVFCMTEPPLKHKLANSKIPC